MARIYLAIACVLLAVALGVSRGANSQATLDASPVTAMANCPVTHPNGDAPPELGKPVYKGGHGNSALWTNLWMWANDRSWVPVKWDHVQEDGSLGPMKWAWYRYIPGQLTIDGRRLDGEADPLRAEISSSHGDIGFQPVGLIFPTEGCWEVTGHVAGDSLTFVTWVVKVNAAGTPIAGKKTSSEIS